MKLSVLAVALFLLIPGLAFTQTPVGTAYFSNAINWSQTPDLYFTVAGAPPNVCGDLVTTRNGSLLVSYCWIRTDSNGSVFKGPWRWADTPADQTDTNVHFNWSDPNHSVTYFTTGHIWDKTCPSVSISTASPGSFTGAATDNQWGAGFDGSWTKVKFHFSDITGPSIYWDGTSYNPSAPDVAFDGSVSPMPSHSVNWSATSVPPASAHIPGHTYLWTIHFFDGDYQCSPLIRSSVFTY
ncbi:MAG TPA: hypothetical protein VHA33_06710 [Candidatus Angelobacter sp.]|jgi:hypothetical protein|nr:hypothetical protein [Candidatus Angelobacter sp.]